MRRIASSHTQKPSDVLVRDAVVEQVAHRVHENGRRVFPLQRLLESFRSECEVEPVLERMARHASKAFRECQCNRDLLWCTRHGVPGRIRALDRRALTNCKMSSASLCPRRLCFESADRALRGSGQRRPLSYDRTDNKTAFRIGDSSFSAEIERAFDLYGRYTPRKCRASRRSATILRMLPLRGDACVFPRLDTRIAKVVYCF